MLARCYNTNIRGAKHYSARGIKVCDRWHEFENFLSDMGPKPTPKHTVEREEVNGDYAPDNCCWITKAEQTRNKRTSVYVDYNGERLLLMDLAARFGVDRNRVYQRLRLGWALDEALLTPLHEKQRVFVDYEGKQRTIASLAAEFNIAAPVLNGRLKRGWPLKRALTEQLHFRSPNRRKTK